MKWLWIILTFCIRAFLPVPAGINLSISKSCIPIKKEITGIY